MAKKPMSVSKEATPKPIGRASSEVVKTIVQSVKKAASAPLPGPRRKIPPAEAGNAFPAGESPAKAAGKSPAPAAPKGRVSATLKAAIAKVVKSEISPAGESPKANPAKKSAKRTTKSPEESTTRQGVRIVRMRATVASAATKPAARTRSAAPTTGRKTPVKKTRSKELAPMILEQAVPSKEDWSHASAQPAPAAPAAPSPFFDPHADPRPLPDQYGATRLTLLVRDPEWLFAYWEVGEADIARWKESNGHDPSRWILRVHDVTGVQFDGSNSISNYDLAVTEFANSWYIHVASPDRSWIVDLGWRDSEGRFHVLARSNAVATPRKEVSLAHDERWMQVDEERFEEVYRLSGGGADLLHTAGSESIAMQIVRRMIPQLFLGGSEQFAGASERLPTAHPGKETPAIEEDAAPFHLDVEFELIVRGRTEPDAHVRLCGEEVRLQPDGSFSVRMALPTGERLIPVKAVKADRSQSREIAARIVRETTSGNGAR